MPKLIILGSSNAVPDENHENTHMILVGKERALLIDCVSNPVVRIRKSGVSFDTITDLLLTHFHPDHVSGVPLFLMDLWLLGRKEPLFIHGLEDTLDRLERMMELYHWHSWPNFFPVIFQRIPEGELTPVLENEEWRVFASPVTHLIPTIGLRFEFPQQQKVLAYSCDTSPCAQVIKLAHHADILIHEAAGATRGHSSASQAAEIALEAGSKILYLIHYPTGSFDPQTLLPQARATFNGPVYLAEDFMEIEI